MIEQLLQTMEAQGIELWVDDGRLKFRAQKGAMTAEIRGQLKMHKEALVAHLSGRSGLSIRPLADQADYELSPAQWRLWVLMQMEDSSVAYNVPLHQLIRGALDAAVLERAVQQLVARHESLRTRFIVVDGMPRQVIEPQVQISLEVIDLSGEADAEEQAWELSREEAKRPFDLGQAPLLHAKLVKIGPDKHAFLLTLHHIICDGVSIGILNREITQLYGGVSLTPLPIQYRDYAYWQNRWLESGDAEAHRQYWLKQLDGDAPVLNLPTDGVRPTVQTFNGREQQFLLGPEIAQRLKQLAREERATLFMVLLATLKAFLYRYTQQTDIVVGSPVAARAFTELYDQVGFYLNTVALRTRFEGSDHFRDLLAKVKETAKDGLDHQIYPFDQLVNDLDIRRDLSRAPLFDVMLILQNQTDTGMRLGAMQIETFYQHSETSKVDLTFNFSEGPAGLGLALEYNTDLFTDERIERMGAQWGTLVEGILADVDRPLGELPFIPEAESIQLAQFNDTEKDYPAERSFADCWHDAAARFRDKTAFIAGEVTLTYGQLEERAAVLAEQLEAQYGIGNGSRVALLLDRTAVLPIALLAVLKLGAAYVPLDPSYPAERIEYILRHSESHLILADDGYVEMWRGLGIEIASSGKQGKGEKAKGKRGSYGSDDQARDQAHHSPDSIAYVTYTSGSTGRPKGVMVSQGNLVSFAQNLTDVWGLTAEDSIVALTTVTFDIAGLELLCSLLIGMTVVLAAEDESSEPEAVLALMETHQVTTLQSTPSRMKLLLEGREATVLSRLRTVLIGGEALPPALFERLQPLMQTTSVFNVYGPTEATIWSTSKQLNDGVLNIGRPLLNEQVYILDGHDQICPIGVIGEICIGGAGVAVGYWQRPELTEERFGKGKREKAKGKSGGDGSGDQAQEQDGHSSLYRTGDLGYWLPNGEIVCLGRSDDQVKIRGFRVELGEVEAGLMRCAGVKTAVAAVKTDSYGDNLLLGFVIPADGSGLSASGLRQLAREQLPEYMVPAVFQTIDDVPLTPNGKVDRKTLLSSSALQSEQRMDHYVAPQTELEKALVGIWGEILEQDRIGIQDNFFDLGGHSLKGMRIVARVQQELGQTIALLDLFQQQTIEALAKRIAEQETAGLSDPLDDETDDDDELEAMTDEELAFLLGDDDEW